MSSAATAMDILESMTLDERIAEVAKDILSRTDRYKGIAADDLADLLDVDPDSNIHWEWEFVHYAPHLSAETLRDDYGIEDMLDALDKAVSPERIAQLARVIEGPDPESALSLLSADEQRAWERSRQEDILSSECSWVIAYCEVRSAYDKLLMFEAKFYDAGEWDDLRTPYDRRDGKFTDLTGCLTEERELIPPPFAWKS
jgi:hypothetical protein